ncbi:MAG: hypothetical protein BGO11_16795 [Solirubrobacterales bacterium 70-9]|nr:MAG: hypothetical protein BGO11_16795 [Solirubrobacterales bacterium 70-9]
MKSSEAVGVGDPYGDFQTPPALAEEVWGALDVDDVDVMVEPTVGLGAFVRTAPAAARSKRWLAWDVNAEYVETSRTLLAAQGIAGSVDRMNVFDLDPGAVREEVAGKVVLALGNPPWVTNSVQGRMEVRNLPAKRNRFGLKGFDALTGKANFDIAEAILLNLIEVLGSARELRLAFLVKRSVAMKMARDLLGQPGVAGAKFFGIDARRWFGAAVEAGLFIVRLTPGDPAVESTIDVYPTLGGSRSTSAGYLDGVFVEDLDAYASAAHLEAGPDDRLVWRQGLKHDLSKVLELRRTADGLVNGFGEAVDIEEEALSPLYKSSDLAAGRSPRRWFPLYQTDLSGPVPHLEEEWPKLAAYLQSHRVRFDARKSRIYRGKPAFMLFGVGEYTTAPFKVAISGFYDDPTFRLLEPGADGAPPLVDDTCYLLPFWSREEAAQMHSHLQSEEVGAFLAAVADRTAKRPYTKAVLGRISVPAAA